MLTLIGAVLGFFTSAIPEIFKFFTQKRDQAHELEMTKLQMEAQASAGARHLEEVGIEADVRESEALYKIAQPTMTGVKWVDALLEALNATVRPTVTYLYFAIYMTVRIVTVKLMIASGITWQSALVSAWSSDDMALFSTIIGFWFGSRSLSKFRKGQ